MQIVTYTIDGQDYAGTRSKDGVFRQTVEQMAAAFKQSLIRQGRATAATRVIATMREGTAPDPRGPSDQWITDPAPLPPVLDPEEIAVRAILAKPDADILAAEIKRVVLHRARRG